MGGNAIDAIGNGYKKASTYLAGFGTKEVRNIKKFLFFIFYNPFYISISIIIPILL